MPTQMEGLVVYTIERPKAFFFLYFFLSTYNTNSNKLVPMVSLLRFFISGSFQIYLNYRSARYQRGLTEQHQQFITEAILKRIEKIMAPCK